MKSIALEGPGDLRLREVEAPPDPGPGEVLVRARRVGICGTDLHAYGGAQNFFSYPRVMGHELAVEVLAIGETDADPGLAVGDICCVVPYLHCGGCVACRRGKSNCCVNMRVLGVHVDGGMRERFTLPLDKLLPAVDLTLEQLALVEMLCIGAHAVERAGAEAGEAALVVGAGPIGLATALFAQLAGADVTIMEVNPRRLAFCGEVLAIDKLVDARGGAMDQLLRTSGGELPTLVFDCTGSAKSMEAAFEHVAHGGKLTLVGHVPGDLRFSDPLFHARELTLLASRNAGLRDFQRVMECLRSGAINLAPWITHWAGPETIASEFPRWLDPATGTVKAMLTFD